MTQCAYRRRTMYPAATLALSLSILTAVVCVGANEAQIDHDVTLHPDEHLTTDPTTPTATTPGGYDEGDGYVTETTVVPGDDMYGETTVHPDDIDVGELEEAPTEPLPLNRVEQLLAAKTYSQAETVVVERWEGHTPTRAVTIKYLAMRGLADLPVLMLEAARYPYKAIYYGKRDFVKEKPSFTFGRVPSLKVPGTATEPGGVIVQTSAIVRHLAHELGLDGRAAHSSLKLHKVHVAMVDYWYETINELFKYHTRWGKAFDVTALREAVETATDNGASLSPGIEFKDTTNVGNYSAGARSLMVLQTFENALKASGGSHLVAKRMTYADLALWCELDKLDEAWASWPTLGGVKWHKGFPTLALFKRNMEHDSGLSEYLLSDRRMPRVERRDDGEYHYLPSRRPTTDGKHPLRTECCKSGIATCLACQHGLSVEELCAQVAAPGCPTMAHQGEL
eukprot:m.77525 g.77525  ORF g.77525 m.77525 type:complete len:452 (-) comp9147_c0_seq2:1957-3312(-)